jgi:hypothetical protein
VKRRLDCVQVRLERGVRPHVGRGHTSQFPHGTSESVKGSCTNFVDEITSSDGRLMVELLRCRLSWASWFRFFFSFERSTSRSAVAKRSINSVRHEIHPRARNMEAAAEERDRGCRALVRQLGLPCWPRAARATRLLHQGGQVLLWWGAVVGQICACARQHGRGPCCGNQRAECAHFFVIANI